MVKYRQATQKPSNVCFTGRGRMERVKNSHWVSVFAHNSHRGWITPLLFKQSDNLLNSSDGHKVLLRKPLLNGMTMRQKGTRDCCISPICPPFTSVWKWAMRRETERAGKSFLSVYSLHLRAGRQKEETEGFSVESALKYLRSRPFYALFCFCFPCWLTY